MNQNWGIYIHVPWCRRRCRYCDFYFEIGKAKQGFAGKVLEEWASRREDFPQDSASTLYFGGGTPSSLASKEVSEIISHIRSENGLQENAEVTLEANPEDLDEEKLHALKAAGVNRLSFGVQSFDDNILKFLGRKHTAKQAKESILLAQDAGFDRISVDFIGGVPGESEKTIHESFEWCVSRGVKHISFYLLTVEEGTPLHKHIASGKAPATDEDQQATVYENAQKALSDLGFRQYEVSSFCVPGNESQHNRMYWAKGMYLGLGPGAHSMRIQQDGSVVRSANVKDLALWWAGSSLQTTEVLSNTDALQEALAFGIRDMDAGIRSKEIADRHRCELPTGFNDVVAQLSERGYLEQRDGAIFLTTYGARFADMVARELLALSA